MTNRLMNGLAFAFLATLAGACAGLYVATRIETLLGAAVYEAVIAVHRLWILDHEVAAG